MERIEADLRESKLKQRSLSKAYESVRAQASSLIIFSVQWGDLEEHFESTRKSIESRFRELERRERDVGAREAEVEAKVLNFDSERESKAGELQGLDNLLDQKLKEVIDSKNHLITLQDLIKEHSDEVIVQERRLQAVEEFVREKEIECELIENRVRDGTKKLNSVEKSLEEKSESLEKLVEEVELKDKEFNENLWLIRVHTKELDLKDELIKAAQRTIEECDIQVVLKEEKLRFIEKSIEECSKTLESREKTMREIDSKEKSFGLLKYSMDEQCCKLEFREREVDIKVKQVGEQQKSVEDGEKRLAAMAKRLQMKERSLEDKAAELALNQKELESMKISTEELSERVKSKERQLEEQAKDLELKQKKFVSIKKCREEQTEILEARQKQIEVQAKELELKLKEFGLMKNSIEELTRNLKVKEGQLEHQTKELELKQREFDSMKKSREERIRNLKEKVDTSVLHPQVKTEPLEYTPSNNAVVPSCTSTSILSSTNRDGRGLQLFMNDHLKRIGLVGNEVSAVLQASSDPAKLVLDAMEGFYPSNLTLADSQCDFDLGVIRRSCIVLLESLTRVSPEIYPWVRQEAIKLAGEWKAKMTTESENWLEILGFLRLVHAFKITSAYDAKELQSLIAKVGENEQATELSQSLGNTDMASASIICSPVKIEHPECSLAKDAANVSSPQSAAKDSPDASSSNLHQTAAKDAPIVASLNLQQTPAKDAATVSSPNLQKTVAKDAATVSAPNLQKAAPKVSANVSSPNLQQTAAKDAATVSSPNHQQTAPKVSAAVSSSNLQQTAVKDAATVFSPNLLKQTAPKVAVTVSSPNHQQTAPKVSAAVSSPKLQQTATTGERNLLEFVNELKKENDLTQDETLAALQRSSDPAKFVLDLMQRSFTQYWGNKDVRSKGTAMFSYIYLLEQLMVVLPHGALHVKFDALKLAVQWKAKMGAFTLNPLEHVGFLQFLATYGLISDFPKAQIVNLLRRISQHRQTPELRPVLAFADKLSEHFIENYIERKQVITAVRLICTFKLADTFPPVPLLKKFVVTRMKFFRRLCRTKKSLDEKDKILDDEIAELSAVIKCIKDCRLESEYPSRNIEIQIAALERIKEAHRHSKASRACKLEQEQKDSFASKVEQQEQNQFFASMVEQNEHEEAIPSNVVQQEQKGSPGAKFVQQGLNWKKRGWNQPGPQQQYQKKFKRPSRFAVRPCQQPTDVPEYPPGSHSSWPDENYGFPGYYSASANEHGALNCEANCGPAGQFGMPANNYEAGAIPSSGLHNSYRHPRYGGSYHA